MKLFEKIRKVYFWHIVIPIDKLVNTLIWFFTPKDKVIVLNVWLTHRGNKVRPINLGDDLNFAVVSYLSNKRIVSYMNSYISFFNPVNYMCIGSIADYLTNSKSIIWGSGAISGSEKLKNKPLKVLSVRGPRTRDYFLSQQIDCPEIYGDPVMLLPEIYPCRKKKKYKIGIIPHFIDSKNKSVHDFKLNNNDVTVVDLVHYKHWKDVIEIINECEIIASSSLHGLIIADAYKIPNVWIKLSNNVIGNDFKFYDYFEGVGRNNMHAYNCIDSEIDYQMILELAKNYHAICYDTSSLLASCPFINNEK